MPDRLETVLEVEDRLPVRILKDKIPDVHWDRLQGSGLLYLPRPSKNWLPPLPSSLIYTGSENIAVVSPSNVWLEIERTSDAAHSTP